MADKNSKKVRIAGAQGFYGDSPMGAMNIVQEQGADYLMHDALAELTLSILQKDKQKDESRGYARDIEFMAQSLYPAAIGNGMRIVTNSGGLNPKGAADKVASILARQGMNGIKIATVTGDNAMGRLRELQEGGEALTNIDTGETLDLNAKTITHANTYIGASSVKEALDQGAHIVFAGRVADPCLALGILCHEFGWRIGEGLDQQGLDLLASGIAVGHVIECGGQASGGNSYAEWPMDYPIANLGYPIAHVQEDGSATFTKLASQGGKVSRDTIREQLIYEIHDPANYITPDVTVDLTNITLTETGENEVALTGVKGKPRPDKLKLTIGRSEGYISEQFFYFTWPYAYDKAQKFIEAVKDTWENLPFIKLERTKFNLVGVNAIHEDAAPELKEEEKQNLNEVGVRVVVEHKDERSGKLAFQGITCLGLNGPPGVVAMPAWGKINRAILSMWPTLIDRKWIDVTVEIVTS